MKDIFFIILVVFSSWTLISGALTTRRNFQAGTNKNNPKLGGVRQPAVSFSAGPAKSKCESQTCRPGYKKKVTAYPKGGCPIFNCVRSQQNSCPPVNCRRNQRKSYSGKKLANGCQEIKCVNNRQPPRAQRRMKHDCPSVNMNLCTAPGEGFCPRPRNMYVNGKKCRLCPNYVECKKPVKQNHQCPDLNRCPSANFRFGECAMPRKDIGGCKQCPRITRDCDRIGGVRDQLM